MFVSEFSIKKSNCSDDIIRFFYGLYNNGFSNHLSFNIAIMVITPGYINYIFHFFIHLVLKNFFSRLIRCYI